MSDTQTCDICWAEIKSDIWILHQAWHVGRVHHDVPQMSTCEECFALIQRDKETEHMEWHTYLEGK